MRNADASIGVDCVESAWFRAWSTRTESSFVSSRLTSSRGFRSSREPVVDVPRGTYSTLMTVLRPCVAGTWKTRLSPKTAKPPIERGNLCKETVLRPTIADKFVRGTFTRVWVRCTLCVPTFSNDDAPHRFDYKICARFEILRIDVAVDRCIVATPSHGENTFSVSQCTR